MPTVESAPSGIDPKIYELLTGESSPAYNARQMQLAVQIYYRNHPEISPNQKVERNVIMNEWVESGNSRKFRDIFDSAEYQKQYGKDASKITVEMMES